MGGMCGGLLFVIEIIGECILVLTRCVFYLLIGKAAWKLTKARKDRLVAGTITLALIIGIIFNTWLFPNARTPDDKFGRVVISFFFVPLVFGLLILGLEQLRIELEERKD